VLQLAATYFLIIIALNLSAYTSDFAGRISSSVTQMYKVNDELFNQDEQDFFARPNNVSLLKSLYEWESTNESFLYIVANHQYVSPQPNNLIPKQFQAGYEYGQSSPDAYLSLQVNQEFIDYYRLDVDSGRLFAADDFALRDKPVPIIMGYDYLDYFQLNDELGLWYMGIEFRCQVVGFLLEDCFYNNGAMIESLDYYILMPSFDEIMTDVATTENDWHKFQLKLFLDKCSGYFVSEFSPQHLQQLLVEECLRLDIIPYRIEGVANFYLTMWGLESQQLGSIMSIFVVIAITTTIICISLSITAKIIRRKYYYAVCMANGLKSSIIRLSVFAEILLMNLFSLLVAISVSLIMDRVINYLWLTGCFLVIQIFANAYPYWMLKKLHLSITLRGDC
jgi:hypothetical protein